MISGLDHVVVVVNDLAAAGVDVSDVRTGRKPGTRVLTVRSGTCGIPTLLVERTAEA